MERRLASYWLFVLIGGPVAGILAGIVFTVFVAAAEQRSVLSVLVPGGFLYTAMMIAMTTAMIGFLHWNVRREVAVADATAARDGLTRAAAKLKFRLVEGGEDYFRFQPRGGLIKPLCTQVEVWLTPGSMILAGPGGQVKRLLKRAQVAGQ
ncbi:MAG TPA: hypothetical protein VGF55_23745 [Gemmataceae bacterium]|jgi:hypothetical protein